MGSDLGLQELHVLQGVQMGKGGSAKQEMQGLTVAWQAALLSSLVGSS